MTTTADRVTATHNDGERPATDPIDLEVVRSRLEAIGEQAALAVEHTAISPTITESKDYSVTIMDPALPGYKTLDRTRFHDLWIPLHNEGLIVGFRIPAAS